MASYEDSETASWSKAESEQSLLANDNLSLSNPRTFPNPSLSSKQYILLALSFLFISIISGAGVFILMTIAELKHGQNTHTSLSLSNIDQTYQKLHTYTDFSSPDDSISAAAWDQYVINGFVALPHTWAQDRGWPLGREMPGDVEKGIYVVDGFHQLHCLMSIREEVLSILDGKPITNITHTKRHLNHCYDALRQAIICRADPTPLYVPKDTFFAGDGQERQCGSWNALQEWVVGHSICYNGVSCEE